MSGPRDIGTLWIGRRLGPIEQLCLLSWLKFGHRVVLYSYAPVEGVPDGITLRDAREIFEAPGLLFHARKNSPAPHADVFRLHLLSQTSIIWMDLDALLVAPLDIQDPHVFGLEVATRINNGVLGLPQDSQALRTALATADATLRSAEESGELDPQTGLERYVVSGPFIELGPMLLDRELRASGEHDKALPPHVFYPIPVGASRVLFKRPAIAMRAISEGTISVHLWGTRVRKAMALRTAEQIGRGYLGHLFTDYGVSLPEPSPPPD